MSKGTNMNWNGNLEEFARYTENTKDVSQFAASLKTIPPETWDDMVQERLVGALGRASLSDDKLDSAKDLERRLLGIPLEDTDPEVINRNKWDVFKVEMNARRGGTTHRSS